MAAVDIRTVDPRDEPAVKRVVDEAFAGETEYALVDALRDDAQAWVAELSLGAYAGDVLVGHILFTRASVGGMPAMLLAPLAVFPSWQGRGVGSSLVRAGLEGAQAGGVVLVLVLGHPGYYPKFGFEPAIPHGIMPPYDVDPAEAWMAVALAPGALDLARGTVSAGAPFMDPALWRE